MIIIPDGTEVNKYEGHAYYERDTIEITDDEWDAIHKGYLRMKLSSEGIMEWQSFSQYLRKLIVLAGKGK